MRGWVRGCVVVVGLFCWTAARGQGTERSLDIQPGARQNGMGATGVALESDPADAMWWNPAALGFAEWHSVGYTYVQLVPGLATDVIYHHAAGAGRVTDRLGVGLSGTFLSYGESTYGFRKFDSTEWSGALAVGWRVLPDLAVGATAKYVRMDIWPVLLEGSTAAFDLGASWRQTIAPVRVGLGIAFQNLGPEMKFGYFDSSSPLSRNLKLGGAMVLPIPTGSGGFEANATAVMDWDNSLVTSDFEVLHYGFELEGGYRRWVRLAARGGYYDDQKGQITDPTWGAGARVWGVSMDYAQIPQAHDSGLPNVEKWTFGVHSDALLEWLSARQPR